MDRLPVYFETREVGWITTADEASGFTYAESWRGLTGAFPVSLTCRSRGRRTMPRLFCHGRQICCRRTQLSGS